MHHFPPHGITLLPDILNRACRLPAIVPSDRDPIEPAHIYVAPPDRHLLVEHGVMRLLPGTVDRVLPLLDIAGALQELVGTEIC